MIALRLPLVRIFGGASLPVPCRPFSAPRPPSSFPASTPSRPLKGLGKGDPLQGTSRRSAGQKLQGGLAEGLRKGGFLRELQGGLEKGRQSSFSLLKSPRGPPAAPPLLKGA